jgi:hypothetical protein
MVMPGCNGCQRETLPGVTVVLDWWLADMRFEHALQAARGIGAGTGDTRLADETVLGLERVKWRLWHGRWTAVRHKLAALSRWTQSVFSPPWRNFRMGQVFMLCDCPHGDCRRNRRSAAATFAARHGGGCGQHVVGHGASTDGGQDGEGKHDFPTHRNSLLEHRIAPTIISPHHPDGSRKQIHEAGNGADPSGSRAGAS